MQNFIFNNPTRIRFGKGVVRDLGMEVGKITRTVLLVYGGKSCKLNGSYDQAKMSLEEYGIDVLELSGVKPNPRISSVRKGVEICKKNSVGAVIALGGGSVIDCAKMIVVGAKTDKDPWIFLEGKDSAKDGLPLFTVLTLAATGSEMNSGAVITNEETNEKFDYASPFMQPRVSFLDPTFTYSVSKWQTAAGTADIMSHIMEQYFGDVEGSFVQDRLAEALLKTCIKFGPIAVEKPNDYQARSNLMWASSLALNGLLSSGHSYPWVVHPIEHPVSGFYDITHGAGLACITPKYFRYVLNEKNAPRFASFARNVFDIKDSGNDLTVANKGIDALEDFFASLGLPKHLREMNVKDDKFKEMAEQVYERTQFEGSFAELSINDIVNIYKKSY
ncbi:MAG: iron-containing alcohol dehydrogenase [Bacilli bacterium]